MRTDSSAPGRFALKRRGEVTRLAKHEFIVPQGEGLLDGDPGGAHRCELIPGRTVEGVHERIRRRAESGKRYKLRRPAASESRSNFA
jgi:hypothetical protein